MNNYINSNMRYRMDPKSTLDSYRKDMEGQVKQCRDVGAAVLLFSPTLTDESFGQGIYEVRGGAEFLKECGRIVQDIAKAHGEGVYYIPIQEEFEAFQNGLAPEQTLRLDGVHPSALGQYQIARTLWEHLNLAGNMEGKARTVGGSWTPVPVTVTLTNRFLGKPDEGLHFVFSAKESQHVSLHWSLDQQRGEAQIDVSTNTLWAPVIPAEAFPAKPGESKRLVFDLAAGKARSLYIVDLACVPVLHPKDGKITGEVMSPEDRPEGRRAGTWSFEPIDNGYLFEGEVFDSEISSTSDWPWARDGVNLYLDLRPAARFADIGFDSDVHITILAMRDQPRFDCTLIPWVGRGMQHAANSGAVRTPTGYRWNLFINRASGKPAPFKPAEHELVGMNLVVVDEDKAGGAARTAYFRAHEFGQPIDKQANILMILDLKNRFPGDLITNVHLFGR